RDWSSDVCSSDLSEEQIRCTDSNHHHEHRCRIVLPVNSCEDSIAAVIISRWGESTNQVHDARFFIFLVVIVTGEVNRRDNEEYAEKVEHPRDGGYHCCPNCDEYSSQHQRNSNANQQDLLLIRPGDGEFRHDDQKNKQVINR